jgi:hypothetical protein
VPASLSKRAEVLFALDASLEQNGAHPTKEHDVENKKNHNLFGVSYNVCDPDKALSD